MHPLAQRVLSHIRRQELLKAGDRVGAAISGGIDSVALLRLLLELRSEFGIVLSVVHFNHKLRGEESDADECFVAELARQHELEFYVDSDDVAGQARAEGVSVESAARELRYGFFRYLLGEDAEVTIPILSQRTRAGRGNPSLSKIATGHTLDDQAETLLMRLVRGSGLRGLGGIYPRIAVGGDDEELCGEIVRPLLATRRHELERYLREIGQSWREDATNVNEKFTRNRVRKLLVPLLEKEFNPSVAENLAELAEIARGEEDYWENEIAGWMGTAVHWSEPERARLSQDKTLVQITQNRNAGGTAEVVPFTNSPIEFGLQSRIDSASWLVMNASVNRLWFLSEPIAVQRRLVKAIGEHAGIPLEFKHVEEIVQFAAESGASGKKLALPLGWEAMWEPEQLVFLTPDLREPEGTQDYEHRLKIPGQVLVPEAGLRVEARVIPAAEAAGYNAEQLLDADSVRGELTLRNWRPGDRFWPAHTKSPKKIKELLQQRRVPQPERRLWPVVACGEEIVWMRGFALPARLRLKAGHEALLIQEVPMLAETINRGPGNEAPGRRQR